MKNKLVNKKIKDFYDSNIDDKYKNDYEFNRWFKNPRLRLDYYMTYKSIKYHLGDIKFESCLELGPGPGTWTRILYKKNPEAIFDLVDISTSMKCQFIHEMRQQPNINYVIGDINEYSFQKEHDFFFSSRAIEYLDDKKKLLENIFKNLKSSGHGMLVTKNPDFGLFHRIKTNRWQHSGQISILELTGMLKGTGFTGIKAYPVIVRLPIIDRINQNLAEKLFEKVYKHEVSTNILPFVESYIIIFKK